MKGGDNMTNKNLLKYHMAQRNFKANELSKAIGVAECTFYRKMNGDSDFTRNEIYTIKEKLELSKNEIFEIFFN